MEILQSKTIIYDSHCPMCTWYTNKFVQSGAIEKTGRVAFDDMSKANTCNLDMNRARHEIPLIDNATGEVLYGVDGLSIIMSEMFLLLKPFTARSRFRNFFKPLYHFISYNRRIIAGSVVETDFAPDFNLGWRLCLIVGGVSYTALCIFIFSKLMDINAFVLFAAVLIYFFTLIGINVTFNKTAIKKWDYMGHLAVLGFIEGTFFVLIAMLAKLTGLPGLMFAGQGAGRLFAIWLHAKRVRNNNYSIFLNYAFTVGAVGLIIIIAIFKN